MDDARTGAPARLLLLYLGAALLLVLPSLGRWAASASAPLVVTAYEYDYFLGFLGADYGGSAFAALMAGKAIHVVLMSLLGFAFWKYILLQASEGRRLRGPSPIALSVTAGLLFLGALAWMSPDVFYYFGTGWLESRYGGNPFAHVIAQARGYPVDPMFHNIFPDLCFIVTPYGPLFVRSMALLTALTGGNQVAALLVFKLACAVAHVGNCVLVWHIARRLGARPATALLAWALNPVVLFAFLAANHNDVFLLLCILAALYLALAGQDLGAALVLGLGVGLKYMPLLLLPFLLLYLTRELPGRRALERASVLCLVFLAAGLLPSFWYDDGIANFLRLLRGRDQLLRNFLYLESLRVIGWFRVLDSDTVNHVKWLYKGLFVAGYAALWLQALRQRASFDFERLLRSCLLMLALYFLVGSPELHEWYLPWFLPFAFLSRDARSFRFGMALSTAILPFIILEVRSPRLVVQATHYLCFAIMWLAALAFLIAPRRRDTGSPVFARSPADAIRSRPGVFPAAVGSPS